ncbi:ribonuclease H-like domain-containing protein [Circinella umbellata]|nr:ribonuclease H-like domain-containing protein [Circinella umbellata]
MLLGLIIKNKKSCTTRNLFLSLLPLYVTTTMTINKLNINDEFQPGIHQEDLEEFTRKHFEIIDSVTMTTVKKPIENKSFRLHDVHYDDLQEFNQEHFKIIDTMNENELTKGQEYSLRILSVDIECMALEDRFPIPNIDPIIQIGNTYCTLNGGTESTNQVIFTLGTCAAIKGATIIECQTEQLLLMEWRTFLLKYNPDILTGYYFQGFDLWYMIRRAETLHLPKFSYLGRNQDKISIITISDYTKLPTVETIAGRKLIDMWEYVKRNYKLKSNSLNSASLHFLGEKKDDVKYQEIPILQKTSMYTRKKLACYCLQDSMLALKLLKRFEHI